MDASCTDDRTSVLPIGGHAAAHTGLASRSLPYDGPGALATITVASSPGSDDPSAHDSSSDSSGCPDTELRHDETIPGPGCFSRDVFLDFYGDVDGAARWERARVYDSADNADGWNIGADTQSIPANPRGSYESSDNDVNNAGDRVGTAIKRKTRTTMPNAPARPPRLPAPRPSPAMASVRGFVDPP